MRISVAMQKQILELYYQGKSARSIARILKKNRRTVQKVIDQAEPVAPKQEIPAWAKSIDWQKVNLEVARGVPMNILSREYASGIISYDQFRRQFYKLYPEHPKATMRLEHKPGEKMFFDFSDGIDITDPATGKKTKTYLLCAVMAMSSYTFGEFTVSQKRDELMRGMEKAFRFFGGVTPYVTVDNQRAAVDAADWYDPEVNPTFTDFANHWGFAVVPARPYRPKDKAANECGIGVAQKQFFQEIRDKTFYSLHELNQAFKEYISRLNDSVMKDWGVSRSDRFVGEREKLLKCPAENWAPREWKTPKVHPDCHVQVAKKFYSVPYQYVGQVVRVRLTSKLVEIFDQDMNPLAVHGRLVGSERCSTNTAHYPEEKLAVAQFSVQQAQKEAAKVGGETTRLVDELLSGSHPLKYLRRVQGILRLYQSNRVTKAGLEYAAKMALTYRKMHLNYVQATAEYFDRNGARPTSTAPQRDQNLVHLHKRSLE